MTEDPGDASRLAWRIARDSAWALAAGVMWVGVERLAVYPYVVRRFGYGNLGVLAVALQWVMVLAGGISAGFATALIRASQWSRGVHLTMAAITMSAIAFLILACALTFAAWLGGWAERERFLWVVGVVGVYGWGVCVGSVVITWCRLRLQLRKFYFLQALLGVYVMGSVAVGSSVGWTGVVYGYAVAGMLWLTSCAVFVPGEVWVRSGGRAEALRLLSEAMQIGTASAFALGLVAVDRALAAWHTGAAGAGVYSALSAIGQMFLFPVEVIAGVLLPYHAASLGGRAAISRAARLWLSVGAATLALGLGWIIAPPVGRVLYGDMFPEEQLTVLRVMLIGVALSAIGTLHRPLVVLRTAPWMLAVLNCMALVLLAVLGFWLGRYWGLAGVAVASAASVGARSVALMLLSVESE